MKLMIIMVRDADSEDILQVLVRNLYRVTRIASTGGFLRQGNSTLLVGVKDEQVQQVIGLVRSACHPGDADNQHRATAFVVNMPYFSRI